jgi:hypothetical protein
MDYWLVFTDFYCDLLIDWFDYMTGKDYLTLLRLSTPKFCEVSRGWKAAELLSSSLTTNTSFNCSEDALTICSGGDF